MVSDNRVFYLLGKDLKKVTFNFLLKTWQKFGWTHWTTTKKKCLPKSKAEEPETIVEGQYSFSITFIRKINLTFTSVTQHEFALILVDIISVLFLICFSPKEPFALCDNKSVFLSHLVTITWTFYIIKMGCMVNLTVHTLRQKLVFIMNVVDNEQNYTIDASLSLSANCL